MMNDSSKLPTVSGSASASSRTPTEFACGACYKIKEEELAAKMSALTLCVPKDVAVHSESMERSDFKRAGISNPAEPKEIAAILKHKLIKWRFHRY